MRELGSTGIHVSVIGLGTVKFGRTQGLKYPTAFELPTDTAIANLLGVAKELGVNLLDTAPAYGSSEQRLGSLLLGQRQEWIIATKAGETFVNGESFFDFSKEAIIASVEQSLKNLKTDYLDLLLIHSNGDDEKIIEQDQVFLTLETLKRAGKVRFFGMSTKTISGGFKAVDCSDVVMVTYNKAYIDEVSVIDYANEKHKGVLIKKALGSGHLPASENLTFVLNKKGVSSVIVGTLNPEHLRENIGDILEQG